MSDIAIRADNVGKKYMIRHQTEGYTALRDVIMNKIKSFNKKGPSNTREEFWALKNVSFDIETGDRVGIIGRNGAGKSTLLKLLSRITTPTTGRIAIKGRVSSLLEVGTGFHPELTGRENIYLNGAILGMSKQEIKNKFDEIVEFAEVEKFLDTPVKRYSSGMYVRLAFSVAAHMEPEILIVDEVLAVGDAQFQKKCLGKMQDIGKDGRTLIFVSHNMGAISYLCNKGLYLSRGMLVEPVGDIKRTVSLYLNDTTNKAMASKWENSGYEFENEWIIPISMNLESLGEEILGYVTNDLEVWLNVKAEIKKIHSALTFGYAIYNEEGHLLYWSYPTDKEEKDWPVLEPGIYMFKTRLPKRLFNEGTYRIEFIASLHFIKWIIEPGKNCPTIYYHIEGGLSDSPYWQNRRLGILAPVMDWKAERVL